jgi:hypothetical protein
VLYRFFVHPIGPKAGAASRVFDLLFFFQKAPRLTLGEKNARSPLMLWLLLGLGCGLNCRLAMAQNSPRQDLPPERLIFKFAPLMAIDFDPSLMFGVEYIFHPKWSFQQELGYGRYNTLPRSIPILGYEAEEPSSTFRARAELRRYLNSTQPAPRGRYLAIEGFYRLTGQHYEGKARLLDVSSNSFVPYNLVLTNHMTGVHIKFGKQLGKKYLTDFFVGIGLRASFSTIPDRPWRANILEDIASADAYLSNDFRPNLALGLKVGLPWKGRR